MSVMWVKIVAVKKRVQCIYSQKPVIVIFPFLLTLWNQKNKNKEQVVGIFFSWDLLIKDYYLWIFHFVDGFFFMKSLNVNFFFNFLSWWYS